MNDRTAHGYLGAPARGGRRRGREGLGGQRVLGFGRSVAAVIEAPNLLVNPV
jgi:hypothetical protein